MSLAIKHGLFKLNMIDHHAILGVSLDADPKKIRLSYLKIAQKLHPDKCRQEPQKAKMAGQILSKLVNPAYEQLSKKSNFAEHQLVLTQVGRRLAENKDKIAVKSEAANELLKSSASAELVYTKLLKKITSQQYQSIEKAPDKIAEISELNLVYLMLKCARPEGRQQPKIQQNSQPVVKAKTPPNSQDKPTISQGKATISQAKAPSKPSNTEEPTTANRVNSFVGRARQYIEKKEFDRAVNELRDALRIDPNHAVAHAVMGQAYLHKKQLTMAKVHIGKACKAEPHNPVVMESKKVLDKLDKAQNQRKTTSSKSNSKPGNSGFFSGFFGSRKK